MKQGLAWFMVAPFLLLVVFGAGAGLGWATRAWGAPGTSAASDPDPLKVKGELDACRRDVKAFVETGATPSGLGPEDAARFEALSRRRNECEKNELLARVDLCNSVERYHPVAGVLVHAAESCADTAGMSDFMQRRFHACAGLDDIEDELDSYEWTEGQRRRLHQASSFARFHKGKDPGRVDHIVRTCKERAARARK